ncbi:hypothetical protein EYF80_064089 [Liparis tanakae]|uniref:Uncharacterized protein n=1 Tax=Liparis tanakae TaxID=230148 RepID=A0A4Z2EAD6_9TELE|nr:hypothetical protein EYF80_064089 [Liparis tanakae]
MTGLSGGRDPEKTSRPCFRIQLHMIEPNGCFQAPPDPLTPWASGIKCIHGVSTVGISTRGREGDVTRSTSKRSQ